MKRLLAFLYAALFLFSACAAPAEPSATPETPAPTAAPLKTPAPAKTPEPAVPPAFTVPAALVHEVYTRLSAPEFKGRFAGAEGNPAAAEYLAGLLSGCGYAPLFGDSMLVPYAAPMGDPEKLEAAAELCLPDGSTHTLAFGADYVMRLPWEDLSLALPITQTASEASGGTAFLLAENGSTHAPYTITERAQLSILKHIRPDDAGRCTISVSAEIAALCRTPGAELRVSAKAAAYEGTAHNVVAVLPGADRSRAMILGAHFDGTGIWDGVLYPSAMDNASGTAALIGAATVLANEALPFDLVIALFNSEENSLHGSRALAETLRSHYREMNLINLDCLGYDGTDTFSFAFLTAYSAFAKALWPYLQHAGYPPYWISSSISSDHLSFSDLGIPSITLSECLDSDIVFHTPEDVPEQLSAERIAAVAAGVATFVAQLDAPLALPAPAPQP